ncbi:LOW QUALITY PROTEIN: mucin-13b [Dicentrarchus labrax]|uniref:LOW QUALITY PROTEIN: mucin-13b n=1 Tax=Dicentrarchus labrax TaxID=13489 RepID=UPI0021F6861C|nr:LOW QUALITY PROTEIN: mucin-13b [Dicentrarchus labrax]
MARELKNLCVLWLVSACLATESLVMVTNSTPTTITPPPTTEAPGASSPSPTTITPPPTTEAPGASSPSPTATTLPPTTDNPGASSPSPTTTTLPPTTGNPGASSASPTATTPPPGTGITGTDSASPPTQPPPTENPEAGPCDVNPCGIGSTCDPRHNQTFVCLCLAGDVYNYDNTICERAKVFPGHLSLPGINYNNEMADKTSEIFLDNSKAITDALSAELNKTEGYSGSIVLEIRPINNGKVWLRNSKGVNATVEITYAPSADIKTEEVLTAIKIGATCSDCTLKGSTFVDENLCDNSPCDEKSVTCSSADGDFNCTCIENYIKTDFSNRICIACPSGTKADESSECVACPFGYSGFNCNESWQLTLVIVGSVLGGLLLITLILLPVVALKSPKKSSKKKNKNADIGTYVTHSPAKAPLVNGNHTAAFNGQANSFANAGVPRIPRATTTSSWDSRTNLEMTPSNSRQNLVNSGRNMRQFEDDDDMPPYAQVRPQSSLYDQARPQSSLYAQARPQNNPYAQDRPQNNPYAQDRPQNNPYASSQGQSNPYYTHDNGRRFN